MEVITNKQQIYRVSLRDGRVLEIKAHYFIRSTDFLSWEFYDTFPLNPKVLPICAIKSALVDMILLDSCFTDVKNPRVRSTCGVKKVKGNGKKV